MPIIHYENIFTTCIYILNTPKIYSKYVIILQQSKKYPFNLGGY
jgi:hypothetical protein